NLGNGSGFSVREVIESVKRVTGREIPVVTAERRAGDPAVLVASAERAHQRLGWTPKRPHLDDIVADAWKFTLEKNGL
ncbi:UDP-glucose 4-epimerase GalE, partial [Kitasatospora sp. NPDC005751]